MKTTLLYVVFAVAILATGAPSRGQAAPSAPLGTSTLSIDGSILYYSNQSPVDGVSMQLQGPGLLSTASDLLGSFSFSSLDTGLWTLLPRKQSSGGSEVSALDAAYVLQAAVGLRTLTPEQALACDVTGNGTVSAMDAAVILQYVIGLIDRLPIATACGSDWAFIPKATAGNVRLIQPQMQGGLCQLGGVDFNPLDAPAHNVDFTAIRFGDCTGNWQPPPVPTPIATASPSTTPSSSPTSTPTATWSPTPSATNSASTTATATRTATWSPTPSATASASATATATGTATWSPTPSATASATATATATRTPTITASPSRTPTPTATASATWSSTLAPTFTPTATASATSSQTVSPTQTPTALCGAASVLSNQMLLMSHPDVPDSTGIVQAGRAHIVTTVPTSDGWGVFWLRDTTGDLFNVLLPSTLYYAHVAFDGHISAGPKALIDIHRHDREPLYMVTWRVDHFGLLVNELIGTDIFNKITYQYYYDVSIDGQLSARVGPIRYDLGPSGGIGEIMPYLDGFMVGVETTCQGSHQCDYAFKLGDHGVNKGRDLNVVEFDGTHSHSPNFAYDGSGVVVISSKDANNQNGGIVSQYISNSGTSITRSTPVIPNHGFLIDSNPDLAWNGNRFAAIWREVEGVTSPLDQNYRMRFATFTRTASLSTLLSDNFLEPSYVLAQYLGRSFGWTTNVSAVSDGWVASFAQGTSSGPKAAIQHLAIDGTLKEAWTPFALDDYALHSSVHSTPVYKKTLGIATTHRNGARVEVTFSTLTLACDP